MMEHTVLAGMDELSAVLRQAWESGKAGKPCPRAVIVGGQLTIATPVEEDRQ